MNKREELMDRVDAMVSSSDMLYVDSDREAFKMYLGRWNRALANFEESQPAPVALVHDLGSEA